MEKKKKKLYNKKLFIIRISAAQCSGQDVGFRTRQLEKIPGSSAY